MADEILGFSEVEDGIPDDTRGLHGRSKYDPLIMAVREGKTFVRDQGSKRAALSLMSTIKTLLSRRGINDINVSIRGTKIYVSLRKKEQHG